MTAADALIVAPNRIRIISVRRARDYEVKIYEAKDTDS
jgi:uncharacterized DUF497 family protein